MACYLFYRMARKIVNQDSDLEIKQAFEVFSNGEQYIPEENVRKIMGNLGEQLDDIGLKKLIVEADHDGDGRINYEDFRLTMRQGRGIGN